MDEQVEYGDSDEQSAEMILVAAFDVIGVMDFETKKNKFYRVDVE